MAYWHKNDQGRWIFDWSHIVPVLPVLIYFAYMAAVGFMRLIRGG